MKSDTFERITRWLTILIGAAFVVLVLALSIMRLLYPYEVEWMEGAMMDHVVRILEAKPIYTTPSIDFVAWLYPPLYYYAVALAMKIFGISFFAGRLVSIIATVFTALTLGHVVRYVTRSLLLGLITTALYFASYHLTGFYFDIVRNDAFFTALLVLLAFVAIFIRGWMGVFVSAILFTVAFLTKQQAIFFLPALALWYWLKDRKHGIAFVMTAIVLSTVSLLILDRSTGGWSTYYLFKIPGAKRADIQYLRLFDVFPYYALGPLAVCSLAFLTLLFLNNGAKRQFWSSDTGLIALFMLGGLAAGAMSLANEGGYRNVLMPYVAFGLPLLPIALSEIRSIQPRFARYAYLPILFQFAALYFNPLSEKMLIASAHQRQGGDAFMHKLAAMPGEVMIPYHGYITRQAGKPSHAHLLAAIDVLRMQDATAARLHSEFDSAYANHRFSAIIMEESDIFRTDSVQDYLLDGRMLQEPNVYLTRVADGVTRPEFIFVPR